MKLTKEEKRRIKEIRAALRRCKRGGLDISTWESTFFLGIIARLTK